MNLTDVFINTIFDFSNKSLSELVLYEAKKSIIDYLGTAFAGAAMLKTKSHKYLDQFGSVSEGVTIIGLKRKAYLHNAAFLNAMSAHVTELDDGNRFCSVHLGATILPALFAVSEHEELTGEAILRGVVIGYEAAIRIGRTIQPSHKNKGYHISGTCGTIGSAMGIAAALQFSKEQMKSALSAAATSSAGLLEIQENNSELKPYNIGRAALDGLTAAYTARVGFRCPDDVLGGQRGFFAVMADEYDPSGLSKKNDNSLNITNVYRKSYAACRHCHPAIEAVINIRNEHNIRCSDVSRIDVKTYKQAVFGHDYADFKGTSLAKMSIPFCVAVAIETGKAGLMEFVPENIENKDIGLLMHKVKVYDDNELSELAPQKRAAIVEVVTCDGKRLRKRVDYPKGEPENPLTSSEIEKKFVSLAEYGGKMKEDASEIAKQVWAMGDCPVSWFDLLQ